MPKLRDYGYGFVIGAFFLVSVAIFLITGWYEYVTEQTNHGFVVDRSAWANLMLRDAFENIQSEMLQLLCQVGLLTWLLFRNSPQSRDTSDRMERKIDEMRRLLKDLKGDVP